MDKVEKGFVEFAVDTTKRVLGIRSEVELAQTCRSLSKQYCFISGCPECGVCQKLTTLVDFEYQAKPKNYLRRKI